MRSADLRSCGETVKVAQITVRVTVIRASPLFVRVTVIVTVIRVTVRVTVIRASPLFVRVTVRVTVIRACGLFRLHVVAEQHILVADVQLAVGDDRVRPGVVSASVGLLEAAALEVFLGAGLDQEIGPPRCGSRAGRRPG